MATNLPPYRPNDSLNLVQPWPRCAKCGGGPLSTDYQPRGLYYMTRADDPPPLSSLTDPDVELDEHLLRTCDRCGYWWRERLVVGS